MANKIRYSEPEGYFPKEIRDKVFGITKKEPVKKATVKKAKPVQKTSTKKK